jgi:hypothetical protein
MTKTIQSLAVILLLAAPAFAGSGPGGVHSTAGSALERFNARQAEPEAPTDAEEANPSAGEAQDKKIDADTETNSETKQ